MSERRQLALLLAGLVALTAVGVVGATLFPERCEGLESRGELDLAFADAADALPVDAAAGEQLQALGEELGIGAWRGAVALPQDAVVSRSEFGFFVVTDEAFTVLRPSMGLVSAARGRVGLDAVPVGTSLALRAPDGETGVVNGEFEIDRCGTLPPGLPVLSLDRGFALVRDDVAAEVALVTLSGDEVWRVPAVADGHLTADAAVLGDDAGLELRDIRDGEVLDRAGGLGVEGVASTGRSPWVDAREDQVLVPDGVELVAVTVQDTGLAVGEPLAVPFGDGTTVDAVATPAGVVALGADGSGASLLSTDRVTQPVDLPAGATGTELHASRDGHVGVVVTVDGVRALLVWGTDA